MGALLNFGGRSFELPEGADLEEVRRELFNAAHRGGNVPGDWTRVEVVEGGLTRALHLYVSPGVAVSLLEPAADYSIADSVG